MALLSGKSMYAMQKLMLYINRQLLINELLLLTALQVWMSPSSFRKFRTFSRFPALAALKNATSTWQQNSARIQSWNVNQLPHVYGELVPRISREGPQLWSASLPDGIQPPWPAIPTKQPWAPKCLSYCLGQWKGRKWGWGEKNLLNITEIQLKPVTSNHQGKQRIVRNSRSSKRR